MNRKLLAAAILFQFVTLFMHAQPFSKYDQQVDSLLAKMTLQEKIGQLNLYNGFFEATGPAPDGGAAEKKYDHIKSGLVGGMLNVLGTDEIRATQKLAVENSRLGIPMIFGYDVIHGYQTMAPIPLAQSASWDPKVAEEASRVAAEEAAAAGLNWTYAPMVDIVRDPRWGRVMESAGEDPHLASEFGKAWVKGFQGEDLADIKTIAACTKHFAGYGFAEAGRDYNTVDFGNQTLYNVVLPPFKATVDAGVATFMNAFNIIDGIPSTGSSFLQRKLLKGDWGFEGFVVSDWGSIAEMIPHGFSEDRAEAAQIALSAGSDMDMESNAYVNELEKLAKDNKVDLTQLDDAVRRILRIKFALGLFDDPYKYCNEKREESALLTEENKASARDIARKSIVLLKNEGDLLPLPKKGKKIAIIGSLANSKDVALGSWRAQAIENSAISLVEGLQAVGGDEISYSEGYRLTTGTRSFFQELTFIEGDSSGFEEAIELAKESDIVIMAMGEDAWQSGEGRSQVDIGFKGDQEVLLDELIKVNPNIVVTLMNGRPLDLTALSKKVPAILEVWHLGSEAGNAIADVLYGDYNPSGKLPMTFPRSVGQVPIYYNQHRTGRPTPPGPGVVFWSHFTDSPNTPLYPFGYGLSYTTFEYSDLKLSSLRMKEGGSIEVSIKLSNTGSVEGEEVVQLYLRDHVGSAARPVKELKGFKKIALKAGESTKVTFTLTEETLSYYRADLTYGTEPGQFTVMIGGNSADLLSQTFRLVDKK